MEHTGINTSCPYKEKQGEAGRARMGLWTSPLKKKGGRTKLKDVKSLNPGEKSLTRSEWSSEEKDTKT